jgi:hypothetical protein
MMICLDSIQVILTVNFYLLLQFSAIRKIALKLLLFSVQDDFDDTNAPPPSCEQLSDTKQNPVKTVSCDDKIKDHQMRNPDQDEPVMSASTLKERISFAFGRSRAKVSPDTLETIEAHSVTDKAKLEEKKDEGNDFGLRRFATHLVREALMRMNENVELAPLFEPAIGLPMDQTEASSKLDAKTRLIILRNLIISLVRHVATSTTIIFILDDIQVSSF